MKFRIFFISMAFCLAITLWGLSIADRAQAAFVVGGTYYISVEAVKSNGQVTSTSSGDSIRVSTNAVADSNGKLSFSLSGLPDNSAYNFLVITIKDSAGNVIRRSVAPAPAAGSSIDFGVSPITENQTAAFLSVFKSAGTDDPLLAFFGFMLVRSSDVTTNEITQMANFCLKGIKGTDGTGTTTGFEAALRTEGATNAQLRSLRTNLVANLSGLSSLYKDSVDQYFTSGSDAEKQKRGEAASKIFEYLVDATSDAGMKVEWLIMGFNDMGAIVCPLIQEAVNNGSIRASTEKAMGSTIDRGLQKLRADNFLKKYTIALTVLGASGADVSLYTTAVNTLMAAMQQKFEEFEKNVMGDEMPDADEIQQKNNEMNTEMETAFTQFMSDTAVSDARITALRASLKTALGYSDTQMNQYLPVSRFKFYNSGGTTVNWSIMQVVSVSWMANLVTPANGGTLDYARDDLAVPASMAWMGQCSDPQYWDQGSCLMNSGTWTTGRRDYSNILPNPTQTAPKAWAALEGIREDIQIAEFTRWGTFGTIDPGDKEAAMQAMKAAEKAFYAKLFNTSDGANSIINDISGTTDGSTAIPAAAKKALITVFLSPDF
ncbi:MAG: hypothetical protein L6416_03915 [Candidatus Omnitrophica bacterium]|nr:hypothetical protein [Candidatus Omnitrophota bacterium]